MLAALASANAADLPMPSLIYKTAPPATANIWTGCYLGGGGGYGLWNQDTALETNPGNVVLSGTTTNGGRGWFAQGQVGCDYQFASPILFNSNLVVGADYEYAGDGMRGTSSVSQVFSSFGAEQMPWTWAAGARAGVLVTPRFLTYFDGGYTQARFNQVTIQSGINQAPNEFFTPANTYNGWFLGSGFEYSFDWLPVSGLFLKTEYRFSSYNTANLPIIATVGGAASVDGVQSTKFTQLISTELVWRFNWLGR
jgi:outer membrane immunogenic protein